jgi:hypothetical protein
MNNTQKVIRDGKVAVLYSPGHGAGWYTWNGYDYNELIFHPKLVEMVENGKQNDITEEWIKENLDLENIYLGGVINLEIQWLDVGTKFIIEEYDGSEFIRTLNDMQFITA